MRSVTWPHTGIEAPLRLWVQNLNQILINGGVSFSAELVHPVHGVVGEVFDEGRGGSTRFSAFDQNVFGVRDLQDLAVRTREEGRPYVDGGVLVETLLNAAVDETEYQWDVDRMLREGMFLVRRYWSAEKSPYGFAWRGEAREFKSVLWSHAERERFIALTPDRADLALESGQIYQMYDGKAWVPLLSEPRYGTKAQAARIAVLAQHKPSDDGELLDGLYVRPILRFDDHRRQRGDAFQLIDDDGLIRTQEWCRCGVSRPRRSWFELWSVTSGFVGAGEVHANKTCRRILRVE